MPGYPSRRHGFSAMKRAWLSLLASYARYRPRGSVKLQASSARSALVIDTNNWCHGPDIRREKALGVAARSAINGPYAKLFKNYSKLLTSRGLGAQCSKHASVLLI